MYERVLRGKVRVHFEISRRIAAERSAERRMKIGIRLRLRMTDVPQMGDWPWEALFDSDHGQFLAVQDGISIVRHLEVSKRRPRLQSEPPLRILVISASPEGVPELNVECETRRIEEALAPLCETGQVELDLLNHASIDNLAERLTSKSYYLLHFIGHGSFSITDRSGCLLFESRSGKRDAVGAERLGAVLDRHPSIRLLYLNACEAGRQSDSDTFSGLAQSLLRQGVPAVLAIRSVIQDRAALEFSSQFYQSLASTRSIEAAVAEARGRYFSRVADRAWALPILYQGAVALDFETALGRPRSIASNGRRFSVLGRFLHASPTRWSAAVLTAVGLLLWSYLTVFEVGSDTVQLGLIANAGQPPPSAAAEDPRCPTMLEIGLEFIFVPADPAQGKVLEGFCLARTELLERQWKVVMSGEPGDPVTAPGERPVSSVNWAEVLAFVKRLNERVDGEPFRIPSEAELEWAAGAAGGLDVVLEKEPEWLEKHANCRSLSGEDGFERVAPVASFKPGPLGFFDLRGNLWEWALERGDEGPSRPMLRGGGFRSSQRNCRAASRSRRSLTTHYSDVGLRIARSPAVAAEIDNRAAGSPSKTKERASL